MYAHINSILRDILRIDVKCTRPNSARDQLHTLQDLQCVETSGKYVARCTNVAGSSLTTECGNQDMNNTSGICNMYAVEYIVLLNVNSEAHMIVVMIVQFCTLDVLIL